MSRLLIVTLFLTAFSCAFGQTKNAEDALQKIESLKKQNRTLTTRITESEEEIFSLKSSFSNLQESTQADIRKAQELQAQSERAMNLALDAFSEKFAKQNESVKEVQDELNQKFNNQLIVFVSSVALLIVLFLVINSKAAEKTLKQNTTNWNSFQEHILKK